MEIQTTIRDFPEKVRQFDIPPETLIRVIFDNREKSSVRKKSHFPFLDGDIWDDAEGPEDISTDVDHYLYDLENVHGG